jgi:hypothetical protein
VQLTPAERYVILIWANNDPTNTCQLEGPEQTQEFIDQFTQREATDAASLGFVEELTEQELLHEEVNQDCDDPQ